MQAEMASLPPDQRKMVEQMMAKKGMSFDAQGTTLRICVSKEQAERMRPLPMSKADYKRDVISHQNLELDEGQVGMRGDDPLEQQGRDPFSSDKAFTGRAVVDSIHEGKPDRMDVESVGRMGFRRLRRRQAADRQQAVIPAGAKRQGFYRQ